MKRAILITTGTVVGLAAVLAYRPGTLFSPAPIESTMALTPFVSSSVMPTAMPSSMPSSMSTAMPSVMPTAMPSVMPTVMPTQMATVSFTGASAPTEYGPVQVKISMMGPRITAVTAIEFPSGDSRSAQINAAAIPTLEKQTLTAQSAAIDGVSGASYTSVGFIESLQSALAKAGG